MIKLVSEKNGKLSITLGLSDDNIEKLRDSKPIHFPARDIMLPGDVCIIIYDKDKYIELLQEKQNADIIVFTLPDIVMDRIKESGHMNMAACMEIPQFNAEVDFVWIESEARAYRELKSGINANTKVTVKGIPPSDMPPCLN